MILDLSLETIKNLIIDMNKKWKKEAMDQGLFRDGKALIRVIRDVSEFDVRKNA